MRQKTVGIIGGMGPEANPDLRQRATQATPANDDQDHRACRLTKPQGALAHQGLD